MRIDCEQCHAAFTIDDALISDRGVRAQCPKCGTQRVVKKLAETSSGSGSGSGSGSAATAPAAFAPPHNPFASVGAPPAQNPFAPAPPPAPAQDPFSGLPAPSANPFGGGGAQNPFAPPSAAANPFGAPPSPPPSANPFGAPSAAAASANPFGAPPANPFGPPPNPPGAPSPNPFAAPSAGPPSGNPFGAPSANPFGGGPPAGNPFGAGADPFKAAAPNDPFARAAAPANDPFARVAVPPQNDPFARAAPSGGDPFASLGGSPSGSASSPFGANPGSSGVSPFAGPSTGSGSEPSAIQVTPFGGARSNLGDKDQSDPFGNKATDDPFAKLPVDDVPSRPPIGAAATGQWTLKTSVGEEVMDIAELRERVKSGAVRGDDKAAPVGDPLKPIKDQPLLALSLPKKDDKAPKVSGARAAGRGLSVPRPLLGAITALVVVVGGGFALYTLKPELFERRSDAGVNPLRRARPQWQRQFPDVDGTAQEHLVEGKKQMRLDTAAGYRKADDELRQALLLDVGNVAATAAWAENFSQLPTVRADLESSTLAQEALDYALKREPENIELIRALASLKLALGNVDEAQRLLLKAQKLAPNDVDTLVVLARSNVDRNPTDALAIVQRDVRAKDPELKVAYVIEGAAQRRLGAFKEAREMLEARLVGDPQNVGALKELAKLELDLGHAEAAITALTKLLDAEDKDVEAHLLRAKITYQIKGGVDGLKAADAQLSEVLAKHEGAAGELLLSVLAHAAYVKSQLGEMDAAIALGERARATDAGYPSALFVLGRAYAQKGDLENAKKTLEQAVRATEQRESFFEPLVRSELAAVQARAGDEQNAIRNDEKVIDYDPRNIRAHFGLAAIYIKNEKYTQAMTIMRRALSNDPHWDLDRLLPTDFPMPRTDLTAFADAFRDAKTPKDDESLMSLKYSSEGMIRYHAGERKIAEGLFGQALKVDRYNHAALLYLSIMNIEDGQFAEPKRRLKLAIETTAASHPVTRLYLARAELASGDIEAARKRLQDLVETEPTLVQARYSLAMTLRQLKLEFQAASELKSVVRQDPDYLPAKQALADKI